MLATNMGLWDRIIRGVIGLALIAAFFLLPELSWRWVFWIGLVPLVTALGGWCPAYTLFGWSTAGIGRNRARHG
jgi:hypothetical protein